MAGVGAVVGILAGMVGLLVSLSAFFYLGITSVLVWKLASEEAETRRELTMPLMPIFFENTGIPVILLGLALQLTEVAAFGGLMVAIGLLSTTERSVSLHPAVEMPLIGLAITTLAGVGLLRGMI